MFMKTDRDRQRLTETDLSKRRWPFAVRWSFAVVAGSRRFCCVRRFCGVHAVRLSPFAARRLQCAAYSVQCAVCGVQCAVCGVQCAVCGVRCAVCGVQCAVCSVRCTVCSLRCAVCSVRCAVCSVQCAMCSVQCAVCRLSFSVRRLSFSAHRSQLAVRRGAVPLWSRLPFAVRLVLHRWPCAVCRVLCAVRSWLLPDFVDDASPVKLRTAQHGSRHIGLRVAYLLGFTYLELASVSKYFYEALDRVNLCTKFV